MQPFRLLPLQVPYDGLHLRSAPHMDVGCFPPHGVEKAHFYALRLHLAQFDARAVWTKAAHDPASSQLQVWIRTADRAADQSLTQDFRGTLVFCGPATSGGGERLCLARNLRAMPICDGDITRMSQTAKSRN